MSIYLLSRLPDYRRRQYLPMPPPPAASAPMNPALLDQSGGYQTTPQQCIVLPDYYMEGAVRESVSPGRRSLALPVTPPPWAGVIARLPENNAGPLIVAGVQYSSVQATERWCAHAMQQHKWIKLVAAVLNRRFRSTASDLMRVIVTSPTPIPSRDGATPSTTPSSSFTTVSRARGFTTIPSGGHGCFGRPKMASLGRLAEECLSRSASFRGASGH